MSWSLSVSVTPKADFDAAVDAAIESGQPPETPGLAEDVAAAKAALKALAKQVKRSHVAATAGGHCLAPGEGTSMYDGLSVSVYGSSPTT